LRRRCARSGVRRCPLMIADVACSSLVRIGQHGLPSDISRLCKPGSVCENDPQVPGTARGWTPDRWRMSRRPVSNWNTVDRDATGRTAGYRTTRAAATGADDEAAAEEAWSGREGAGSRASTCA
jgi:hypothetical protein